MLRKFLVAYKHRKAILILRLIILILFAPYAAKAMQSISVEESEYLPSSVESIQGNELMSELFANASLGGDM